MDFDYEKLRRDLIDYYGTASIYNMAAIIDIGIVENASGTELLSIAQKNGFNLDDYVKEKVYIRKK